MRLSERVKNVAASKTIAINNKAKELMRAGADVVDFGLGEPDFDTPAPIVEAAKAALDEGYTRYSPVPGIPELKDAITGHIERMRGVKYATDQVIATCGAKSALFAAFQTLLNPCDEVIIPAPYWVSYPDQVKLADGVPRFIETREENRFKITVKELEEVITEKSRILIINSPSNPTGGVYSRDELSKIAKICSDRGITIIADEIYDQIIYDGEFCSVINASPQAADNTIYINGVSKSYAMTGWRMGYAAGPKNIIAAMIKYQSQVFTCIPPFVQKAAAFALNAPPELTKYMYDKFKERRDLIFDLVEKIPGISALKPQGAFYIFVNVKSTFGKSFNGKDVNDSHDLAELLINEARVALMPSTAFGMEGYLRISFATSDVEIKRGMERIGELLKKLN